MVPMVGLKIKARGRQRFRLESTRRQVLGEPKIFDRSSKIFDVHRLTVTWWARCGCWLTGSWRSPTPGRGCPAGPGWSPWTREAQEAAVTLVRTQTQGPAAPASPSSPCCGHRPCPPPRQQTPSKHRKGGEGGTMLARCLSCRIQPFCNSSLFIHS